MAILKSIGNRIWNKGSIIAIISGLVTIAIQLGFKVNSDQVMTVVEVVCGLLITMGILNNPVDNTKAYIPGVSDAKAKEIKDAKAEEVKPAEAEVNATEVVENIVTGENVQ